MPGYKLYRINGAGEIFALEEFDALNDASAISAALAMQRSDGVELWRGASCILSLPRKGGDVIPFRRPSGR